VEAYEFGPFVLDVGERRLSEAGRPVPLAPKVHEMLVALVRRAGTLVSKQELLDIVWTDTCVEEGILAVHVSTLRKILAGRGGADYIETVRRAGYRFTAAVRSIQPEPFSVRWPVGVLPAKPAVSELIGDGRLRLLSASRSDVPRAVEAFRAAVALDPNYAAAHAGLALACCAQAELRLTQPQDAYADARAAALRALAMDPANADAQVALGTVLFLADWNWIGARRSFERALQIDPDHTEGLLCYGRLLEALGELDRGLTAKQKALERNPTSAAVHLQIAHSFWNQRRYDDVILWANRSLALDPGHLLAREYLAGAYLQKGDVDRWMAENLSQARTFGAAQELIDEVEQLFASGGRAAIVEHTLRESPNAPAIQRALFSAEAGNLDEAFRQLDRAIECRDPALVHLAVAPQWDVLRGDPRFAGRLQSMGLNG
jgi:DNA-binding winged helix-turn-helix (wHTH) protein/tetratricopeptide (TPR) repeat protein